MTKTKTLAAILCCLLVAPFAARSAPVAATTPVLSQADSAAPVIGYLKAGSEPMPAAGSTASTPAGWMAVELTGPIEGYVSSGDFTKSLDVKAGASVRLDPRADAPVVAVVEKGEKAEVTSLGGRWTKVSVSRKLTGFIRVSSPPPAAVAAAPAGVAPAALSAPSPTTGPALTTASGDSVPADLPRLFQGRFDTTRRPLLPRRPYDFQIVDATGSRIAYVDIAPLLLTEQVDRYVGRMVVVTGVARNDPDARAIVIVATNLQIE